MGLGWDGLKILSSPTVHSELSTVPGCSNSQPWTLPGMENPQTLWDGGIASPRAAVHSPLSFLTLHSPDSTGAEHTSKIPDFSPKSQVQDCVRRSHWISRFHWDLNFLFPLLEGSCMSLGLLILVMQRQQR